ncbi:MAG: class I SAM-dependent methyltransferase [Planctomycetes bacterium]|nr:class I SAM-dependent methyltransferase [Planctomycetota bacterium]
MELARRHLGKLHLGVEIGASTLNPFEGIRAYNVDYVDTDVFKKAQHTYGGGAARIDVVASADAMPFRDGSLEFVLASHVLEHMVDTIKALREWDRVLAVGGIAFLIVPHKERTFDAPRPRTPFSHLLADHAEGMTIARDPQVPSSHYHCWITEDGVEIVTELNRLGALDWEILDLEDVDSKVGNGFTIVARKRSIVTTPSSPATEPVAFWQWTLDLPFQVIGRTLQTIVPGSEMIAPVGLPAGSYRVLPVHAGFPPRAGEARRIAIGDPLDRPDIKGVEIVGHEALLHGTGLGPTTWLEALFPNGQIHCRLPLWRDGRLVIDLTGMQMPPEGILVTPVNPEPGGGRGEQRRLGPPFA